MIKQLSASMPSNSDHIIKSNHSMSHLPHHDSLSSWNMITIRKSLSNKIIIRRSYSKYDYHRKDHYQMFCLKFSPLKFLQNSNISCKGYRPREPRWYLTSFDPTRRLRDRFWRIRPTSRKNSNRFAKRWYLSCIVLFFSGSLRNFGTWLFCKQPPPKDPGMS